MDDAKEDFPLIEAVAAKHRASSDVSERLELLEDEVEKGIVSHLGNIRILRIPSQSVLLFDFTRSVSIFELELEARRGAPSPTRGPWYTPALSV